MNRLTRKTNIKNNLKNCYYYENINNSTTVDVYNKLGKLEDLMEENNINTTEELESIVFMFKIINKKGFLPLLVESMQSLFTEEGGEYFMTEEEYKVFKEYYPKRMIRKNYGDIDEKLSIFDKE